MTLSNYFHDESPGDCLTYYSNKKERTPASLFDIGLMVAVWFISALVTVVTSREIMTKFPLPFLLCSMQYIFASMISLLYLWASGSFNAIRSTRSVHSLVCQISATYALGFILSNSAFSIVSASFAETVNSAEPLSTVALGLLYFSEETSLKTYLTLIPISVGVGVACYHSGNFSWLGLALMSGSNLFFSSRSVLAKKLSLAHPDTMDEINLFANTSIIGLMFLIPVTFLLEGKALVDIILETENINVVEYQFPVLSYLTLINGVMFACSNLMSYLVLKRTDLVTHSVLNVFRRVVIIVVSSYYFNQKLSPFNMAGISLAVIGVILFCYFRSRDKPNRYL